MNSLSPAPSILIVDDNPENLRVLGNILQQNNFAIEFAISGEAALKWLNSRLFDLVLLDINMPGMDGFEVCMKIRANESLKNIPVIFLSAESDRESILKGFELGAQDYITKPFDAREMLSRIKTHLALKKSLEELAQLNKSLEKKVAERTEQLQDANEKLESLNLKLVDLDKTKSQFLNIISHEIRTPLNGIVGPLSILSDCSLPPEVCKWIKILDISAKRLEEFSYKSLDITRFNASGKDALLLEFADVNEIIASNIDKYEERAEKKNIHIVQIRETEIAITLIDETFMGKCFSYLIDNAIKFGNQDSQVLIKVATDNNHILISVEDEGMPFPEDFNISSIQPFNTKNHVDRNPALSLFLCKQIIEAHDGQIEILSTQKGAKVTVTIPKKESI